MKLSDIINMYKPSMAIPFCISLIVFFAYMILQLIELNTFVKGMDVTDPTKATKSTLVFAYMVGYLSFFFKLLLQMLTLVVLITLIMWLIIGATHMLRDSQEGGGNYTSARELHGGESGDVGSKMKSIAIKVVTYVMGVIFLRNFMVIFLFIIPIFLLFFTIMYFQFYDRNSITRRDGDKSTRICMTNHNFMMFMITSLAVFAILSLSITYLFTVINMGSDKNSEGSNSNVQNSD